MNELRPEVSSNPLAVRRGHAPNCSATGAVVGVDLSPPLLTLARSRAREAGVARNRARLDPGPKHADVASQVSTYREQVTRELSALAKAGILQKDGGALVVSDVRRLEEMVAALGQSGAVGGHLEETLLAIPGQESWRPEATPGGLPAFLGHPFLVTALVVVGLAVVGALAALFAFAAP